MLDGQIPQTKTYMAVDKEHNKDVIFQATSKAEAREMLIKEGLAEYQIIWESTPHEHHE